MVMANIGRIAGGISVIVGGFAVLFDGCEAIFWTGGDPTFQYMTRISLLVTILCSILILIGGVLLCLNKGSGSIIALTGCGILILGWFIPLYSFVTLTLSSADLFVFPWVAPVLIISGSIVGLVLREKV